MSIRNELYLIKLSITVPPVQINYSHNNSSHATWVVNIICFLSRNASKSSSRATAHSTAFGRWYNMWSLPAKACTRTSLSSTVRFERSPQEISANRSLARKSCWKVRAAIAVHLHHFQGKKGGRCSGRTWTGGPARVRLKVTGHDKDRGKIYIDHLLHDWSASLNATRRRLTMAGLI